MNKNTNYYLKLQSLAIFRKLLNDPVMDKLLKLLTSDENEMDVVAKYSDFASCLLTRNDNLSDYILSLVLEDENIYILKSSNGDNINNNLKSAVISELNILEEISRLTKKDLVDDLVYSGYLSEWETSNLDFNSIYQDRIKIIDTAGYGIYAKYHTFQYRDNKITPVINPDTQKLSQLNGYTLERQKVIENTMALINGKSAANVLLYGDAGTGKSSTVKGIVNEYKDLGLRLIELKKQQLHSLPIIIDEIGRNPLKFIIFIDDLSFASDDDDFGALKAILEGSISHKTKNIAIYATSNRRHLVKEKFSDRDGDDIHRGDSMAELISLSDRFGLKVTFLKPNKELYLSIVDSLAKEYNIDMPLEELQLQAEEFAIRRSGRSARVAKQFIQSLQV